MRVTDDNGDIEADQHRQQQENCHKANKGLFFGLFVLIVTIVLVSSFFALTDKLHVGGGGGVGVGGDGGQMLPSYIVFVAEMLLLFLSCILVVISFFRMQQLRFSVDADISFDSGLLVVALFGVFTFNTFRLVSSIANVETQAVMSSLSTGTCVLSLAQSAVQTVFILDSLRRGADVDDHVTRKPGRALITCLLLCNLSLWIIGTFEVERGGEMSLHFAYYGGLAWNCVMHACVPMIIFYRFHSSVCLSEIWLQAYQFKIKKH